MAKVDELYMLLEAYDIHKALHANQKVKDHEIVNSLAIELRNILVRAKKGAKIFSKFNDLGQELWNRLGKHLKDSEQFDKKYLDQLGRNFMTVCRKFESQWVFTKENERDKMGCFVKQK